MACLSWNASQSVHLRRPQAAAPRGRRRLVVAAAAQPASPRSGGRGATQRALVSALLRQARREVWGGWLSDLVVPLLSDDTGSPVPPPVTRPARELADPDSLFATVDGVTLHYKQAWPAEPGTTAAAAGGGSDQPSLQTQPTAAGGAAAAAAVAALERPLLLLVHGFNGSVFSWRSTMQEVADATGCRVVAFDRPPFGLAERPLSWGGAGQALQYNPYRAEGAARLAAGLLDQLGAASVVAVGHSAGALVCMELAALQPQRVAALGFVAPALPTTPDRAFARRAGLGQQLRFALARAILADDRLGLRYVRRQILRRRDEVAAGRLGVVPEDSEVPQDMIDGYLKPLQAEDWDRGALLNLRAFSIPPAYDYAALSQPVLLVQGSNDGGLTENARELASLLRARPRGSTLFEELQGVGHAPMDETPDRLNRLLVEFVKEVVDA